MFKLNFFGNEPLQSTRYTYMMHQYVSKFVVHCVLTPPHPITSVRTRSHRTGRSLSIKKDFFSKSNSNMGNLFCFASNPNETDSEPSLTNISSTGIPSGENWKVSLGAGCYWGTEKFMKDVFPKRSDNPTGSIISGKVGFMGPKNAPANPSYKDVCTGKTKHVEVYDVEFTGGAAYFEAMIKFFFMFHDPTTFNRQGNDTGTQYASVIYCYNKEEFDIATKVKDELQELINKKMLKNAYSSFRVTTSVRMVEAPFFEAHKEHQDYLAQNPNGYCNHGFKFKKWPELATEE
jgi:peptide-methionine (S)-S-oxide reductase